jgi:hypothetical protein
MPRVGGGDWEPLRSLEGTLIHGRKLKIRKVGRDELDGCEAVFIGRSSGFESVIAQSQARGLLTIGNDAEFIPKNGMIALVVENRRVNIDLNRLALKRTDWVFSSHLLEAARVTSAGER